MIGQDHAEARREANEGGKAASGQQKAVGS